MEETLFGVYDKVETAIQRLRAFEPPEGYYLAFSGGKDSQCIYHLCKEAGVRFDAHYSLTTVDPPEAVYFIREHYPDLEPQAAFLRVRSLSHLLLALDQTDGETRKRFAAECREARTTLGSFAGFFLREKRFGMKERVTDLLLAWDLYRLLRPVFHR